MRASPTSRTGRASIVRVNDRGPFLHDRIIDLSYAAAHRLGVAQNGSGEVEVDAILPGTLAASPLAAQPPLPPVAVASAISAPLAPPSVLASAAPCPESRRSRADGAAIQCSWEHSPISPMRRHSLHARRTNSHRHRSNRKFDRRADSIASTSDPIRSAPRPSVSGSASRRPSASRRQWHRTRAVLHHVRRADRYNGVTCADAAHRAVRDAHPLLPLTVAR